jgi:hypothetical protein
MVLYRHVQGPCINQCTPLLFQNQELQQRLALDRDVRQQVSEINEKAWD